MVSSALSKFDAVSESPYRSYYVISIVLLSIIGILVTKCHFKRGINKPFCAFATIIAMISIIHLLGAPIPLSKLIVDSSIFIIPILIYFYFYSVAKDIPPVLFRIAFLGSVLLFLYQYLTIYLQLTILSIKGEDATNSQAYIFMYILPLFLLSERKVIRFLSIVFTVAIVISSFKRSGSIAIILSLAVYYFVNSNGLSLKTICFFIVGAVALFFFVYYVDNSRGGILLERISNLEEDQGSGRLDVYSVTWDLIKQSDAVAMLFGHGWNSVVKDSIMDLSAHNDGLEIWYDCGLVGFVFYVSFIISLLRKTIHYMKVKTRVAAPFVFSVCVFMFNTTFAHIILYPMYFITYALCWGYMSGINVCDNENRNIGISCRH